MVSTNSAPKAKGHPLGTTGLTMLFSITSMHHLLNPPVRQLTLDFVSIAAEL